MSKKVSGQVFPEPSGAMDGGGERTWTYSQRVRERRVRLLSYSLVTQRKKQRSPLSEGMFSFNEAVLCKEAVAGISQRIHDQRKPKTSVINNGLCMVNSLHQQGLADAMPAALIATANAEPGELEHRQLIVGELVGRGLFRELFTHHCRLGQREIPRYRRRHLCVRITDHPGPVDPAVHLLAGLLLEKGVDLGQATVEGLAIMSFPVQDLDSEAHRYLPFHRGDGERPAAHR